MTQRRLSSQQKNDVVVRYLDGENTVSLGLDYGISVSAICGILERRGISRRNRSEAQRKCSLNEYAFDNPTSEAIYWAGFIFADGSLFQNGGSPAITLKLSETDLGHVEKFRSFLESSHSIVCVKPRDTRIRFRGARPGFQYSVRSHRLVSRLEEFGWRPKLGSVACLEFAHSSDFWRGVIDGDGYLGVGSGKRTNLARLELVGGRPLLCQFLDFVRHIVPEFTGTVRPHKSIFRVGLGAPTAYRVIEKLYANPSVALARKHHAAVNILNRAGQVLWDST